MRLPGRRSRCKEELVYPSERKRMEQVAEFATKAFERHVIIQNVSQGLYRHWRPWQSLSVCNRTYRNRALCVPAWGAWPSCAPPGRVREPALLAQVTASNAVRLANTRQLTR